MRFADLTTLRVGGDVGDLVDADSRDALVDAARSVWSTGDQWLVIGGGSNIVASDDGFSGSVIRVLSSGIEREDAGAGRVRLRVQAGVPWDELVAATVDQGLGGIEALSGIPGSTGAAPMQNIGAYGQEVGDALVSVEFLDYGSAELERLPADALGLEYRSSVFKRGRQGVITAIELELTDDGGLGRPVAYAQLADALGVEQGQRVPVAAIRDAVIALRRSKGMVLDSDDTDSWSAGSFFTNPIVGAEFAESLASPRWPAGEERVKLSAAWLIEHAGIRRGFSLPGSAAAVSSKHTLAITNTGAATAAQVTELARFIRERVRNEFGVALQPEPVYVGFDDD